MDRFQIEIKEEKWKKFRNTKNWEFMLKIHSLRKIDNLIRPAHQTTQEPNILYEI